MKENIQDNTKENISYIHLDITKKQNMCDMYRDLMSLVQKNKTTITLKLKQVCATHSQ